MYDLGVSNILGFIIQTSEKIEHTIYKKLPLSIKCEQLLQTKNGINAHNSFNKKQIFVAKINRK